jgi:lactate dehydrogenase-like 2-hydroxyacid dehydrogenase
MVRNPKQDYEGVQFSLRIAKEDLMLIFRVISGAGYDQIDVNACTARDIRVSNVPTAVDDATADTNMFLILGALRGFNTC